MADVFKGIIAGLVATLALSALMIARMAAGLLPQFDPIELLANMLVMGGDRALGWVVHFVLGAVVWGALYALTEPYLPVQGRARRGTLFGVLAWLMVMLAVMPLAGAGVFALRMGVVAPFVTLVLHLAYGVVLGSVYGRLAPTRAPVAARDSHRAA